MPGDAVVEDRDLDAGAATRTGGRGLRLEGKNRGGSHEAEEEDGEEGEHVESFLGVVA